MPDNARLSRHLRNLRRPAILLAIAAALALALAFAIGGWTVLLYVLPALPAALLAGSRLYARPAAGAPAAGHDGVTGLPQREGVVATLDRSLRSGLRSGRSTAVLVASIDGFHEMEEFHEHAVLDRVLRVTAGRLAALLGPGDTAGRLEGGTFVVALSPSREIDLEAALQLAGRLQRRLSEPMALGDASLPLAVTIGLALSGRLADPTGEGLLHAATLALIEARRSGPGAIRSYSDAMRHRVESRGHLAGEVAAAIEKGEVEAYFQPQISTRTGAITGFEALARWQHPTRGLLPPGEFLPAIEQAGLMSRLGERMLTSALSALRDWEREGIHIPSVGVNFSNAELCDPRLVERIVWELDRFDLTPDRLVVEVLETVVAQRNDDAVIRNLAGLARLGCCLDLDDFGTGQASISSIRRFSIERIKIDRSFVTRIDRDPEQSRMVGAILTMAERLGLDTLAEGVETVGERQMLTRLGCGHVQGFLIARPMPFSETIPWIRASADSGFVAPPRSLRAV